MKLYHGARATRPRYSSGVLSGVSSPPVRLDRFGLLTVLDADQIFAVRDVPDTQTVLGLGARTGADAADLIEVGA